MAIELPDNANDWVGQDPDYRRASYELHLQRDGTCIVDRTPGSVAIKMSTVEIHDSRCDVHARAWIKVPMFLPMHMEPYPSAKQIYEMVSEAFDSAIKYWTREIVRRELDRAGIPWRR